MPSPRTPSDFIELIPSEQSTCEKVQNLLRLFPERTYDVVSYMWNEDGSITDAFKADLCALGCLGGDGTTQPADVPQNVMASDGQFSDKVRVTWDPVAGAVEYRVYRNIINDSSGAELLGSTGDTSFNDLSAEPGQIYYYWVRSVDSGGVASQASTPDTGYISGVITAVSDLEAGRGYGLFSTIGRDGSLGIIPLVWTPPNETVDVWDIYMNTADDFDTATRVDIDRAPFDVSDNPWGLCPVVPCSKAPFVKNSDGLVYYYEVQSQTLRTRQLYFWVVGKRRDGVTIIATTGASNSSSGWSEGFGDGIPILGALQVENGESFTIPAGVSKAFVTFFGHGGSGAGTSLTRASGGGGGAAAFSGAISVTPGGKLRIPATTAPIQTASEASAVDSPATTVEYSANGLFTDTVQIYNAGIAGGGQYDSGGDGAGGAGSVASAPHASVMNPKYYDGTAGAAGDTLEQRGGRGGRCFGGWEITDAHFRPLPASDWSGQASLGGGGGGAAPFHSLKGGKGYVARALIYYV